MAAKRRTAAKVRVADEFVAAQLAKALVAPVESSKAYGWSLTDIMGARDEQMVGNFRRPVALAAAMRTDDALAVAFKNRLATQRTLGVRLVPAAGGKGRRVAYEAADLFGNAGVAVSRETLADINGDLANHGIAVGWNEWIPRDDGSRLDVAHHCWPLEHVYWDATARKLFTYANMSADGEPVQIYLGGCGTVEINHGDGRWVVYSTTELSPWQKDSAVLPGALVWARHAFAARDWSKGSASHGNAKVIGQLPDGVPLQSDDGAGNVTNSPEGTAFAALIKSISSQDCPAGVAPAGAKIDYLTNGSRAWEVWRELMANAEKAAARIYLGTDGTLGSQGGAPGIDISQLFNVATTILQADLASIERGLRTGVIEPWCALNFGDSLLAPRREFVIPDPDEQREREDRAKNEAAFIAAITARRGAGLVVTQEIVDELADRYGVSSGELAIVDDTDPTMPDAGSALVTALSVPERFSLITEGPMEIQHEVTGALRDVAKRTGAVITARPT